jgi:rod shape-determining protein MreC
LFYKDSKSLQNQDRVYTIADMKGVKAGFPIFVLLLLISLLIFFFSQNPLTGILQAITLPIQNVAFMADSPTTTTSTTQLQQENNQLRDQLAEMQEIQQDDQALHDQFRTATPAPQKLLPANVVGMQQNAVIIDKGQEDSVKVGNVVVFKDNLIGIVSKITPHLSQVTLLTDPTTSFTAQSVKTQADGIIRSEDGGVVTFDNVVLSDKLENNDIVVTKGTLTTQGTGLPPKLVVGKIVSVEKQASSLFQSAKIQSLVSTSDLKMVFVIMAN